MKNKLEVIAFSVEDSIKIEEAGADRIELVVELERGGLTPPMELAKAVIEAVKIPVRVMVRDTDESFVYDETAKNNHLNYIKELSKTKAEGIVFGSQTKEGKLDLVDLQNVIEAKGNLKIAYHRAFDNLSSEEIAFEEFKKIAEYDVHTLLTSGLKPKALDGATFIKKLVDFKTNIEILAGSGVGIDNAEEIIEKTGVNYLHVGYAVRDESGNIDIEKIRELKERINND